jgi:hypothetical protein
MKDNCNVVKCYYKLNFFRGESGNTSFKYLRTISRGVLEYEGIEAKEVDAKYSWRKVGLITCKIWLTGLSIGVTHDQNTSQRN